ncbi:MAG: FHA domain-containing protein [Vicinamibacteria bacterium]
MRALFGDFVLDTEARELRRRGRSTDISPQALDLLALLIERRPAALGQAELREALWPDSHVGYTSLARVVSEARRALGEAAESASLVRTVPRFGYAFAGDVVVDRGAEPAAARYLLAGDDGDFVLSPGEVLIGRGPECAVRLTSGGVSRVHARVRIRRDAVLLDDRDSKNGTWVNGARIAQPVALQEGDEVVVGDHRLLFRSSAAMESTRTAARR